MNDLGASSNWADRKLLISGILDIKMIGLGLSQITLAMAKAFWANSSSL